MGGEVKLPMSRPAIDRLIFVIDAFSKGGAQKNLQLIIPELLARGCSVDLILLQNSSAELDLSVLELSGVTIYRINASNMFDLFGFVRFFSALRYRPAVIVANLFWSQVWSSISTLFTWRHKVVWVEHNTYLNRSKMQWVVFRLLSRHVNVLLSVSKEIQEFVTDRVLCQTRLVSNAALSYFTRNKIAIENPKFLLVGRLVEQKNPTLALRAFKSALLNLAIPDNSRLLIIGSGPLESQVKELAIKLGIASNVEFLGFLDSHEISKIMAGSHVLLMTSFHEGSPLVRLEALAHGMAIVTTKTAGITGILTAEKSEALLPGIFVCDSNSEVFAISLARAVEERFWSPESVGIRLKAAEKFHPAIVASTYFDLLAI